ncbi:MAG: hypothetical protein L3J43_03020 [Sulfurovum sp.]|nr:hypothetical protein [Sulfurovum sp.]
MKRIVLSVYVYATMLYAEPSVYGNKSDFNSVNKKAITLLKRQVRQQNERIAGLTSIIEGLSATVNKLQQKNKSTKHPSKDTDSSELLEELGRMIDEINENYVSKEELIKVLETGEESLPRKIKNVSKSKTKETESLKVKNSAKLYSEGVRLFVKKRYDEAKKRFTLTDSNGHKPAASNYYLGEIAYYTKNYEDAIFYFKKSAGLYDKASYIDVLLLHTAISLENTDEKIQAKAFYENIIENYKEKKTATIARDKLKKL